MYELQRLKDLSPFNRTEAIVTMLVQKQFDLAKEAIRELPGAVKERPCFKLLMEAASKQLAPNTVLQQVRPAESYF